jgi:hypothetical protein
MNMTSAVEAIIHAVLPVSIFTAGAFRWGADAARHLPPESRIMQAKSRAIGTTPRRHAIDKVMSFRLFVNFMFDCPLPVFSSHHTAYITTPLK